MLKDITIGQYYPADSAIHKLDPRVKIIATIIYIVSLFITNDWVGYLAAFLFLAVAIQVSKVPITFILKGMKSIAFLLGITVLFNLIFTPGDVVLLSFWRIQITDKGLAMAVRMGIRLSFLIVGTSLMTLTTTPNQLTNALERLMKPLNFILPVHEIAMMMSIALRFIPILMEETDKIMKAQMARGADFENGNIITRIKNMVPLLVPLFISAFRRANDLAMAMEARCYHGGAGRTQMKPLSYRGTDMAAYGMLLAYLALCIVLRIVF
jgi:energy-coupling factor transport system permease protein